VSDNHILAAEIVLFESLPEWVKSRRYDDPSIRPCLRIAVQHGANARAAFFEAFAEVKTQSSDGLYKDYFEHLQFCPHTIGNTNTTAPIAQGATVKNYVRPTEEQMPAALAEVMYPAGTPNNARLRAQFIASNPMKSRDGSRLAVKRCAELGLMQRYSYHLATEVGQMGSDPSIVAVVLATPAQESYAAHRTLCEHRIAAAKETK
jgi:hypothetical protein